MPVFTLRLFLWLLLSAPGVSSLDIWLGLTSPSDGSGWTTYPQAAVEVEIGAGPVADVAKGTARL